METKFLELQDYFLLVNRIAVYLIRMDNDAWSIQKFGKETNYYFNKRDSRPTATL